MVVAPMVDASELAWRMLSRRYGAELCYTPMLHSSVFVKDARYRKDNLASCSEDRPLIVQFCANDPEIFAKACELAAPFCDAIDLNLGCPQTIAKKGHYGAFLMEEWNIISEMIKKASSKVDIPITAKIRIFPDVSETIQYAKMLETAGVSVLTVHGRTRDQKGALTGVADWNHIKAVRESVNVPVFANGNIQFLPDVERCLKTTGVQGVMSAEGNLHNPALYTGRSPPVWEMALEYLELVKQYPCPLSYSRGHVFKLMHHCFNMPENFDIRFKMSKSSSVDSMIAVTKELRDRMIDYHENRKPWNPDEDCEASKLPLPPWLCQPYVRIPAEDHLKKVTERQQRALDRKLEERDAGSKRAYPDGERQLSKKKLKKLQRNPNKNFGNPVQEYEKCICKNPRGSRCSYLLCRSCCKFKCHVENLECKAHRILIKSKQPQSSSCESTQNNNNSGDQTVVADDENIVDPLNRVVCGKNSDSGLSNGAIRDRKCSNGVSEYFPNECPQVDSSQLSGSGGVSEDAEGNLANSTYLPSPVGLEPSNSLLKQQETFYKEAKRATDAQSSGDP